MRPVSAVTSLMLSYIARRILLMVPTLFGIMLISFAIVQFAPGGPVERIIAQLQGQDVGATSRDPGGGGDFSGGARAPGGRCRRRHRPRAIAARRASTRNSSSSSKSSSASTSLRMSASSRCSGLCALRFRQELFPRRVGAAADQGEAAGLDHARSVDDASFLRDLDPARHQEGGAGTARPSTSGRPPSSSSATRSRASCSRSC